MPFVGVSAQNDEHVTFEYPWWMICNDRKFDDKNRPAPPNPIGRVNFSTQRTRESFWAETRDSRRNSSSSHIDEDAMKYGQSWRDPQPHVDQTRIGA